MHRLKCPGVFIRESKEKKNLNIKYGGNKMTGVCVCTYMFVIHVYPAEINRTKTHLKGSLGIKTCMA